MSVGTVRGGVPHVWRQTGINTTGRKHTLPHNSLYLIIRVTANPCRLFFTQKDYDDNVNYVLVPVPSAGTPHGEWQGPVETGDVWLRADTTATDVELVTFQRRG
jgi:hypothetical protein